MMPSTSSHFHRGRPPLETRVTPHVHSTTVQSCLSIIVSSHLLQLYHMPTCPPHTGDEISSKQLRDDLMTMLIAGHETTAAGDATSSTA
jgi:hypothetical protein